VNFDHPRESRRELTPAATSVELRSNPRFTLNVELVVHSHSVGVLKGKTVDISESGLGAILKIEIPLNEVVQLDFKLPEGSVEIEALVRQRNAFRYGFQFVEQGSARDLIVEACRKLQTTQATSV
jgi:PilZ domain